MKSTIRKLKSTFDKFLAKYKKDNAHTKIDKIRMSGRLNRSFRFPHASSQCFSCWPMWRFKAADSFSKPSRIVWVSESENSIQPCCFLLLDIQCPNPRDLHL
jgi:hypothetical protein